jgi:predicted RNase H-like HicB family nuclease
LFDYLFIPDLPRCFSAGNPLYEAIEMVKDAIDGHYVLLVLEGGDTASPFI